MTRKMRGPLPFALLALVGLSAACEGSDAGSPPDGSMATTPDGSTPQPGAPRCTSPTPVACVDQSIGQLLLKDTVNPTTVANQDKGGGVWESQIDARAGGMTPNTSFIYVRFTAAGLEKQALSDEDSFESMDWDISFRRYFVQSNSGASGPSCVQAAKAMVPFDQLTTVPQDLRFDQDVFLDPPGCNMPRAMSQLGGPLTALGDFYKYTNCLTMTGQAFVIRLRDGRHVALQVLAYYPPAVQDTCNRTNSLPTGMASGGGQFQVRWKFLAG